MVFSRKLWWILKDLLAKTFFLSAELRDSKLYTRDTVASLQGHSRYFGKLSGDQTLLGRTFQDSWGNIVGGISWGWGISCGWNIVGGNIVGAPPKQYHMLGYNDKIPIKTPKILQTPMFGTFLTFLIFLMVTKTPVHPARILTTSQ